MDLINKLEVSFEALIAALEEQDADKIIEAAAAIRPLVSQVESLASRKNQMTGSRRLSKLVELIDAAQYRIKILTQMADFGVKNMSFGSRDLKQPSTGLDRKA